MSVVDSSIEALAFNPVNLGPLLAAAVNSFWAWVAVMTAAVSFWRLRSTSTSSISTVSPPAAVEPETTSPSEKMKTMATSFQDSPPATRSSPEERKEEEGVLTRGNSMKELFTAVYYNNEEPEEERESNDDKEEEEDEGHVDGGDETVVKRWKRTLTVEMRGTGDLGWYSYQDRGVIDGSVVRLWGEERESDVSPCSSSRSISESPRSCRRRFTVTTTSLLFT